LFAQFLKGHYYPFEILFSACADARIESIKDFGTSSAPVIVRKDVVTQTGPDISRSSSPSMRSSFSCSLSVQQIKELEGCFSNLEIRDAQVDDRVTLTRWSKAQGSAKGQQIL